MQLKKGEEFLELKTGIVFRIYHISKHGMMCNVASRKGGEGDFILHTSPAYTAEDIVGRIKRQEWIPNTPAGRALYGFR